MNAVFECAVTGRERLMLLALISAKIDHIHAQRQAWEQDGQAAAWAATMAEWEILSSKVMDAPTKAVPITEAKRGKRPKQ